MKGAGMLAVALLLLFGRKRPKYGEPGYREAEIRKGGAAAQQAAKDQVARALRERARKPPVG